MFHAFSTGLSIISKAKIFHRAKKKLCGINNVKYQVLSRCLLTRFKSYTLFVENGYVFFVRERMSDPKNGKKHHLSQENGSQKMILMK